MNKECKISFLGQKCLEIVSQSILMNFAILKPSASVGIKPA